MKRNQHKKVIALDVGGTNIRVAVVSSKGTIDTRYKCKTLAEKGPEIVIKRLIKAIQATISKSKCEVSDFEGISLAIAGSVDINNGLVNFSPHLPQWVNVPLRDIVLNSIGIKTELLNDASAAALGEHRCGAGRGISNMVHITIGTGIGGGIIINNKLYLGADGIAGEFGHTSIIANGLKCSYCGNRGCWEMYASGSAIERQAKSIVKTNKSSLILTMVHNDIGAITGQVVAKAAAHKDPVASRIIEDTAYYFGIGLSSVVNIFNPEMIVVGGGLSSLGEKLLKPARKVVRERAFSRPVKTVKIIRSFLGDNAGLIGAAMYINEL